MIDLTQKARANRLAALARTTTRSRDAHVPLVFIRSGGVAR